MIFFQPVMIFFQFLHGGMNLREAVFTIESAGTDPCAACFEENVQHAALLCGFFWVGWFGGHTD